MKVLRGMLLAFLLTAVCALPAMAAEKANMKADTVSFDYENKTVSADGNAVLEYDGIHLTADYMEIDLNENLIIARGHVTLREKDREVEGDELLFDLDTRAGLFRGMNGKFTDPSVSGPLHLKAGTASISEDEYYFKNAELTTCSLQDPHYHLEAEEVEVYLGDKIVLRGVKYYEGHLRLFSLPYMVISLRDDGLGLQMPQVGYSPTEGIFVKTSYGYLINENHTGVVRLDMMGNMGLAAGIEHRVRIGKNFTGTLGAYELLNRTNTHIDWRLSGSAEQKIGSLALNLAGTITHEAGLQPDPDTPPPDYNIYQLKGGVTGQSKAGLTGIMAEYRHTDGYSSSTGEDWFCATGNTNLKWESGYSLSLIGSYKRLLKPDTSTPEPDDTRLDEFADYTLRAGKAWDWGSISLLVEEKADLDPSQGASTWRALLRQPEVTLLFPKVPVPVVGPFRTTLSVSRYIEKQTVDGAAVTEVGGTRANAEIERQALNLTYGGFNLVGSAKVRGSYYDTGDALLSEVASLTWNQKYVPWLRSSASFSWTELQGETPFTFDRPVEGAGVAGGLYVEHKVVQASLTSGYDFLTKMYRDVSGRLRVNFSDRDYLQFTGTYNPNTNLFGLFTLEGNIAGEKSHLRARIFMNPNTFELQQTYLDAAVTLFDRWSIEGKASMDQYFESLNQATAAIAYEWDCRQIKFSYDFVTGAFRFELIIKAFPSKPLGFGS